MLVPIDLYFILILGGIIGMFFSNSIFVEAMVVDNNNELEEVKELKTKIERLLLAGNLVRLPNYWEQ